MILSDMRQRQGQSLLASAHQRIHRLRGLLTHARSEGKPTPFVPYRHPTRLSAITEEGMRWSSSSSSMSMITSSELRDTTHRLEAVVTLLSSNDIDQNRIGLQRLMVLTKTRIHGLASHFQASHAVVYGGGATEEKLRMLVLGFLNDDDTDHRRDDASVSPEDATNDSFSGLEDDDAWDESTDSLDSMDEDSGLRGKSWGSLHLQALHVISNALEQIVASEDVTDGLPLDFTEPFWRRTVDTLVHNVEWYHSMDVTGYSLKVLRLLHTFEPVLVTPLIRHTLFPHLVHLEDYGKENASPFIESEASRLLKRADATPSNRLEI